MSAIKYAFVALALKSFFADALESGLKVTRKLEEELGWSYSGVNGPAFFGLNCIQTVQANLKVRLTSAPRL